MEYLVTMTTHVPEGTSDAAVQDIRTRESARSRELAAQGHLLRLWRPPLQPGEWRTLGLFAADDDAQLEKVLTSMPLRVWRTDEVTPLSPHPNDPDQYATPPAAPARRPGRRGGERGVPDYLRRHGPGGHARPGGRGHRGARGATRAGTGRAGTPDPALETPRPGPHAGPVASRDVAGMEEILASLPLSGWMSVQTTPLSPHPSDPALTRGS